jgi:hypothetical protein
MKAGESGSWKRLLSRGEMHQKKCRTDVQGKSKEQESRTAEERELPTAAENKTLFALLLSLLVTFLRRYEAFRCRLGAKLSPAGLL